jgi:hypothetical protein
MAVPPAEAGGNEAYEPAPTGIAVWAETILDPRTTINRMAKYFIR